MISQVSSSSFFFFIFKKFSQEVYLGRPGDREALHLEESVRSLGGEAWLVLARKDLVGQKELDLGVVELLDCQSAALAGCSLLHLHDLD